MFSSPKKRICLILTIALIGLAAVFLSNIPVWLKYKKGDIRDFSQVQAGELKKGDLVRGTIDSALGPCAEEYSTTYGVRTSKKSSKLYYVLWMDNEQFILYEAGSNSFEKLDKITEETIAYQNSYDDAMESGDLTAIKQQTETMPFEGRVVPLTSEMEGFFRDWFNDGEADDGTFDKRAEKVMIRPVIFDRLGLLVILGFVFAVLAAGGIVLTILVWKRERNSLQYGY
ncbi:MAG: hypothetical protein J6Z45_02300 [Oscillospiraceae bacterium]|nr:hypothetical protein [Oscillospiraceae bacterium]